MIFQDLDVGHLPLPEVEEIPPANQWAQQLARQVERSSDTGKVWPQSKPKMPIKNPWGDFEYCP